MTVTKHRSCPTCGAKAVPILFGMPMVDAFEAAERGELVIGGCVIEDDAPTWQCSNDHAFGRLSPALRNAQ